MRHALNATIACALAWAVLPAADAPADGCMMPVITESTEMVTSPRQEAVLVTDGERVQVILRTHFRAGPKELAWVVPVPGKPENIRQADDSVFTFLQEQTAPRFYTYHGKGGGLGCGCGVADKFSGQAADSVVVEQTGTAGIFEFAVLAADDPAELTKWLNEHKYLVPFGAERVFSRYVAGGWRFLAMRVRPQLADQPTLAPHPITYTYEAGDLTYPLVISQLSADLENEILVYVVAPGRYACGNWANATLDAETIKQEAGSPTPGNYEKAFRAISAGKGGPLFVTEFAQPCTELAGWTPVRSEIDNDLPRGLGDAPTITRLRALMTATAMDRDVTLVPVAGWGEVENRYVASAESTGDRARAVALTWALVAAAGAALLLGVRLLGGSSRRRMGGLMCLTVGCAILAAL